MKVEIILRSVVHLDPRLIIGILLVAGAVAGVFVTVQSVTHTERMFVAATDIAPGETLRPEHLREVDVNLADGEGNYLSSEQFAETSGEFVVTQAIRTGELIPRSVLGSADSSRAAVVVPIAGKISETITTGTVVQVWAAAPAERPGTFAAPTVIVGEARVVRVMSADEFVVSRGVDVELLVPDGDLAAVLSATANEAQIQLVPVHTAVDQSAAGDAAPTSGA